VSGGTSVTGELYEPDLVARRVIDVERQVPLLFTRETIELADSTSADA
jgi:hypothetical protein